MRKDDIEFINSEGLKFFGRVTASISHELKNILAIISETAGFLNDLTELAKKGKKLELSMLENCSSSIAEDIQRGFKTIRQMNRFAHSTDNLTQEIILPDTIELIVSLSKFLSYSSNVTIIDADKEMKPVFTSPFLLQNLIYQILCLFYKSAGPGGTVQIRFNPANDEQSIHLIFSNNDSLSDNALDLSITKTATVLGIEIDEKQYPGVLDIKIPYMSNTVAELSETL